MARKKTARTKVRPRKGRVYPRKPREPRFVGRDASPVLDRYPPKEPASVVPASPVVAPSSSTVASPPSLPTSSSGAASSPPGSVGQPLITLDRPFDVDEFATLLGEPSIRVTVPREALGEVLRRVLEFMGFGIYIYAISVRPAPSELLKAFVVELQRVDYSAEKGVWVPFVEKGTTDSPFGPAGNRS